MSLYSGSGFSGQISSHSCSKIKTRERPSSARPSACADMAATQAATKRRRSTSEFSCNDVMIFMSFAAQSSVLVVFCMMSPRMQSSACSNVANCSSRLNLANTVGSSRNEPRRSRIVFRVEPCAMSTMLELSCARIRRASWSIRLQSNFSVPRATAYSLREGVAIKPRRSSKYWEDDRCEEHATGNIERSISSTARPRSFTASAIVEINALASSRTD
mmetsp:Transcript_7048/g.17625  ORF Transcript_7048/g.17625 Transcript_7048/m.17625 type:complete len:217 (-) Transcript_7048:1172-1822(-)